MFKVIDLHFHASPNGYKIAIFLEESGLKYRIVPCDIARGDQFRPEYLKISPNNKMPAIVDHEPMFGGEAVSVFESGAILCYLAEKIGRYLPASGPDRVQVLSWLFWQVGGVGPMLGQLAHFKNHIDKELTYPLERYTREAHRLYAVLDKRLEGREYITANYSIADIACYPWIELGFSRSLPHRVEHHVGVDLDDFPNVRRWIVTVSQRKAVQRAYEHEKLRYANPPPFSEEDRQRLFMQSAQTVRNTVLNK